MNMTVSLTTHAGERVENLWMIEDDFDFDGALEDIVAEFRRTFDRDLLLDGCTITIEQEAGANGR